jgi:C1A family cysteine protease
MRFALLVLSVVTVGIVHGDSPYPPFPEIQHITGVLSLPYAELQEPFEYWLMSNGTVQGTKSRIDWFGGLDTVIQRPDIGAYGTTYKFSHATVSKNDALTCFVVPGEKESPAVPDHLLPDVEKFTYQGQVQLNGQTVNLLLNQYTEEQRINTYKFYYTESDGVYTPVQYSMLGYDTLLGSHYDRYDIFYTLYDDNVSSDVFDYQDQFTCKSFPGPGVSVSAEKKILLKPVHHLLSSDGHVTYKAAFNEFKREFGKKYETTEEERSRVYKYTHNLRFIHSKNRAGLSYKLAVNHFADTDQTDRKQQLGLKRINDGRKPTGGLYDPSQDPEVTVPETWDWRIQGAVTQVKDQAVCGSCWSFGTTGTLEGAYYLKTGILRRLSEQNLVDCSWTMGNDGCDGGEDWRAYEWIMHAGGIDAEYAYGGYLGQNGICHFNQSEAVLNIANYTFVKGEDPTTLKKALIVHGPISIGIDASHKTLSFYHHGVYYDPDCGNTAADLDHAVLLVGFGTLNGEDYWLVKNSWSTYWGNLGYVTMAIKDNNCGVMTQPSYVELL